MKRSEIALDASGQRKAHASVDDVSLVTHARGNADAYEIHYCADRHYLQMRLVGEWNEAVFERFATDYRSVVARLDDQGGITHSLVDASGFGLQSPEIAERFAPLISATGHLPEQRSACVVPVLVNRVQARQGGDLLNARYFRTVKDAADWLFSDEA